MNHPLFGARTSKPVRAFCVGLIPSCASAAILLAPVLATYAHPGHALNEHGAAHVVTSPYHLGVLALAGAGLWFAGWFVHRRLPRRLLQYAGVAIMASAAMLCGLHS